MAIIGTLPNNIQDGQLGDAVPVMADFNFIVNQVNANANAIGTLTAPSGTRTVFHQAAAPLGWSQDTTLTDHTIQIIGVAGGGEGGTTPYSSMFNAQWSTDAHALAIGEMPAHNHGVNDPTHNHGVTDPGHQHALGFSYCFLGAGGDLSGNGSTNVHYANNLSSGATTGIGINGNATGISIQNTGGGGGHSHTKTFASQFIQCIVCQKS